MTLEPMERLQELLATRATEGLPAGERDELGDLLREYPNVDGDALDLAAAEAYLELRPESDAEQPLPRDLHLRLVTDGESLVRGSSTAADLAPNVAPFSPPARTAPSRLGWWVAAACLLLAIAGWWPRLDPVETVVDTAPEPAAPTVVELRQALLDEGADTRRIAWTATEDPAAEGAEGDVVWSDERQQGYMTIRSLEANDPAASQYQLWIFDAARDERYPVDGGVFDVPAGGEVVVPIDAKVLVEEATLFAITVEKPGGVVVSDRERIVLLAQV